MSTVVSATPKPANAWVQAWALARAEWLRMASSPGWAVLLALWTLVCGLFFAVVLRYAAANELPAGETPMGFFFRFFPGLLPLVLVVFIPPLTAEVLAGRRETQRLEHLHIAGTSPGALIGGAALALLALLLALAVPPLVFHLLLVAVGPVSPDPGRTVGGLLALGAQAVAITGLGLLCSAIATRRQVASLCAVAIGLLWWLADFFARILDPGGVFAGLRGWLGLSEPVYRAATGQLQPGVLVALVLLGLLFVATGRACLLLRQGDRHPARWATLAATVLLGLGGIAHALRWNTSIDITWRGEHAVSEATRAAVRELHNAGGIELNLVVSAQRLSHPVDGVLAEAARQLADGLNSDGLRLVQFDPGLDPAGAGALCRELHLSSSDLSRPLLVLRHAGRAEVMLADQLGVVADQHGDSVLRAVSVENAVLVAARRLAGGASTRLAIACGPTWRSPQPAGVIDRDRSLSAWLRLLRARGMGVHALVDETRINPLGDTAALDWSQLADPDQAPAAVLLAGPRHDLTAKQAQALEGYLRLGGGLLLVLDGQLDPPPLLPRLAAVLAPYGIGLTQDRLIERVGGEPYRAFDVPCAHSTGPAGLAGRDGGMLRIVYPLRIEALSVRLPGMELGQQIAATAEVQVLDVNGTVRRVSAGTALPCLLFAQGKAVAGSSNTDLPATPRIVCFNAIDSLSDQFVASAANAQLGDGMVHWLCRRHEPALLPPRVVEAARYQLSTAQYAWLAMVTIVLPILALAAGLALRTWRRRA